VLILIYCPTSLGGIPEHANYQARALSERSKEVSGEKIVMLCDEMFLLGRQVGYKKVELFNSRFVVFGCFAERFGALVDKSLKIIADQWLLAWEVIRRRPNMVLLASYSEYLAPLWFLPHWILARFFGVVYVANLHDPVRDYVVGPRWWHELSVAMAYWPISVGVVHQRLPELSPVPKHVQVVEAPVGVYDLQESPEDPVTIRSGWDVPKGGVVFLAFGFIRDNKNLDLVIRGMLDNPKALLVVMGKAQSQKDKPVDFYRNLALELGVGDRVRFFDEFVLDEKLASYFAASDVVVLTYDKTFHSQSGVLNVAARARRPVLASAGESPLKDCVQRFRLGVFVESDNLGALKEGMRVVASDEWRAASGEPDWEGYEAFASWDVNVAKILEGVEKIRQKS
jgi:glycosyltransferase involved in cell wall biosynthesis